MEGNPPDLQLPRHAAGLHPRGQLGRGRAVQVRHHPAVGVGWDGAGGGGVASRGVGAGVGVKGSGRGRR